MWVVIVAAPGGARGAERAASRKPELHPYRLLAVQWHYEWVMGYCDSYFFGCVQYSHARYCATEAI